MLYLSESDVKTMGIDWKDTIDAVETAVKSLKTGDYAQPIKPYLRYRDPINRIIAMPAFVGGDVNLAGIKWIASFPKNIDNGIPRAHSVIVLNQADTGQPICIINTALLSIIRTSSVSGLMIRHFDKLRPLSRVKVGITGWGPIGRHHYKMCTEAFGDRIERISLFDLRPIDPATIQGPLQDKTSVAKSWQEAYRDADVFMTCTVSKAPYIDEKPKPGSLHLNVSLRDYTVDFYDHTQAIVVDDWEEVCREKTDIENMHQQKGLQEKDTLSIAQVVCDEGLKQFKPDQAVMFNPMGMAVFDIATARYYMDLAHKKNIGQRLA